MVIACMPKSARASHEKGKPETGPGKCNIARKGQAWHLGSAHITSEHGTKLHGIVVPWLIADPHLATTAAVQKVTAHREILPSSRLKSRTFGTIQVSTSLHPMQYIQAPRGVADSIYAQRQAR